MKELKFLEDSIDRVDLSDFLILLVSWLTAPVVLASRCSVMSMFPLISEPTPGSPSMSNGRRVEALRECPTMVYSSGNKCNANGRSPAYPRGQQSQEGHQLQGLLSSGRVSRQKSISNQDDPTGKFTHIRNGGMAKIVISLSGMQWGCSCQTLTDVMRGRGARWGAGLLGVKTLRNCEVGFRRWRSRNIRVCIIASLS